MPVCLLLCMKTNALKRVLGSKSKTLLIFLPRSRLDLTRSNSFLDLTLSNVAWLLRVFSWLGRLTSAQVMISQLVSSSPALGSVLTPWRREPASDSVSPSLSLPLPAHTLCVFLSPKINKNIKKKKKECNLILMFTMSGGLLLETTIQPRLESSLDCWSLDIYNLKSK